MVVKKVVEMAAAGKEAAVWAVVAQEGEVKEAVTTVASMEVEWKAVEGMDVGEEDMGVVRAEATVEATVEAMEEAMVEEGMAAEAMAEEWKVEEGMVEEEMEAEVMAKVGVVREV
jgi:hypothetical protein